MADYVDDVRAAARGLATPPVVVGWSMGGLAALMYAAAAPVRGVTDRTALTQPTMPDLDPEEVAIALSSLGPESAMARQDRQRGIPVDPASMSGPVLVVGGERDETIRPPYCRRRALR